MKKQGEEEKSRRTKKEKREDLTNHWKAKVKATRIGLGTPSMERKVEKTGTGRIKKEYRRQNSSKIGVCIRETFHRESRERQSESRKEKGGKSRCWVL